LLKFRNEVVFTIPEKNRGAKRKLCDGRAFFGTCRMTRALPAPVIIGSRRVGAAVTVPMPTALMVLAVGIGTLVIAKSVTFAVFREERPALVCSPGPGGWRGPVAP